MEDHYRGFGIQHRTRIGPAVHSAAHVHAAILDLPAPALDQVLGHESQVPVCEHRVQIVLIPVELSGDSGDVVLLELLPDPAISHCVPEHDTGVYASPTGPPEMPEISHGPEIFLRLVQHPVYGASDNSVEIEIQQTTLYVLSIKHLHLVPPAFFAACYAGPVLEDVFDHCGWYRSIVFGEHMKSHRAGEIGCDHVMQSLYVFPRIKIAMYHTGAIYGVHGRLPLLFFHWDIYRVMYADKYPYENHRTCHRRI